jgi:hypothetical protein
MKFALAIILTLGIGVFFLFNRENDSRNGSSSTPPDSELAPDNSRTLESPIHATNLDPVEEELMEENDEKNKLFPDSTSKSVSFEIDSNESTTRTNKYIRLARKALGEKFMPPAGVNPVVTQEEGLVVVTYPVEQVTRNGVPLPGPDYYVQVKFNASTDEVVSIQAGS